MKRLRSTLRLLLLVLMVLVFATSSIAQSGRIKDKTPKPLPRPRAGSGPTQGPNESSNPPISNPQTPQKESPKGKSGGDNREIEESDIVRVTSNLVPIPASVVDSKGFAITGLKLEDFELRVDGQLKPISDMTRAETSVKLVMLFDNSASVSLSRDFEKQAAKRFFRQVLRPSDEAAIYSVESDSYLAQPLTKDISRLEYIIDTFSKPAGSTSLFDSIVGAAAYLRPYEGRRVLVIVSDGIETTSRTDFADTLRRVLADDCQVFVVQTGIYDDANLRALAAERRMEQISSQTGGAVYIPKTTAELDHAFQNIAADLAQQYVLSYYPGDEPRDGRFHLIDLRIRSRKDVRVRARKGYYSRKSANIAASDW